MADLNSLGFTPDEEIPADDIADIPEPTGGFEFLQPNKYKFQLPSVAKGFTVDQAVDAGFVDKFVTSTGKEYARINFARGKDVEGKTKGSPLRVVGGGLFGAQISNVPMTQQGKTVNDFLLLLKALGETTTPKTNLQYIQAILKYADAIFGAEVALEANATNERHKFEQSFRSWVKPGEIYTSKGSGKVFFGLPKDENGQYIEEFMWPHPQTGEEVSIRVFQNLRNFYSVKNGHA
jgi:hypothetical protein